MGSVTRPFGVTLVAALHVLQAIFLFLVGLALVAVGESLRRSTFGIPHLLAGMLPLIGGVLFVIGILDLGLAYGLWTGKGWAWIISLILAILGIIGSLFSLARGGFGAVVILILDAIILYYLTRPNVKAFFGESKKIVPTAQPSPTVQTAPAAPSMAGNCKNCGAPVKSGEKFCSHCGAQVR